MGIRIEEMKSEAQGARPVRPLMSAALEAVGMWRGGGEGGGGLAALATEAAVVGLSLTRLVY